MCLFVKMFRISSRAEIVWLANIVEIMTMYPLLLQGPDGDDRCRGEAIQSAAVEGHWYVCQHHGKPKLGLSEDDWWVLISRWDEIEQISWAKVLTLCAAKLASGRSIGKWVASGFWFWYWFILSRAFWQALMAVHAWRWLSDVPWGVFSRIENRLASPE